VYIGDWSNPRPLQWHIDNATDLVMRRVTIVSAGGTSDHSALSNLEYANSGHTGFASQEALEAEAQARHEEITTAIDEEAAERQQEIEELNAEIQETNRVLSGKVTQTLANITLNTTINGETAIAKTELAGSIPLIAGGSWASDMNGTLAIYAGDLNPNTAIFRTKTTTGTDTTDHAELSNLDYESSGHTGFVSETNFNGLANWVMGTQAESMPSTITIQGDVDSVVSYPYADFIYHANAGVVVAPNKALFFDKYGSMAVYIGDGGTVRPVQWHIDNQTDLAMRIKTIADGGGIDTTQFAKIMDLDVTANPAPPLLPRTNGWRIGATGQVQGGVGTNYLRLFFKSREAAEENSMDSPELVGMCTAI